MTADKLITQEPLLGLAKLMRMAYSGIDLAPVGAELIERAKTDADAHSLMDLSTVLQLRGNRDLALTMQAEALKYQTVYSPPTAKDGINIRLCALMCAGDLMANTPLEFLLEDSDVALDLCYLTADGVYDAELPEHDLLFIAIAQSDRNMPLLNKIATAFVSWPRPILNKPERIGLLSRHEACRLLKSVPGVTMPVTLRIHRQALAQAAANKLAIADLLADGDYPVIIRPVDSHAGQELEKIDGNDALAGYLQNASDDAFYVSRFIDYRGNDGQFRKYRIVLIEGRPFLCHLAISEHWLIHYLNAGMAESPEKRAEEERAMADFDLGFALRHAEALRDINERMGLDYLGIDCSETADGKLLIFEVDSSMIIHAIDPVDIFPYKQTQMRKVFTAFRQMLANTAHRKASVS